MVVDVLLIGKVTLDCPFVAKALDIARVANIKTLLFQGKITSVLKDGILLHNSVVIMACQSCAVFIWILIHLMG